MKPERQEIELLNPDVLATYRDFDTPTFDVRTALCGVLGVDLTEIQELVPSSR
jgi:hypothetical protein